MILAVLHPPVVSGIISLLFIIATFLLCRKVFSNITAMVVLSCSILIFITIALANYHFIVDDVYISLRYARNLAEGYGLVFSTDNSPPVEGYTNFLWVIMEAGLFKLNLDENTVIHLIRISGIIFGIGVIILTFMLSRLITGDARVASTAAMFLAIVPEMAFWAVGGLETSMFIFWMMLGIYLFLVERRSNKTHFWSAFVLFLMALTRPEGLIFAFSVLLFELVNFYKLKYKDKETTSYSYIPVIVGIITFTVCYGAYFLWRYNFYNLLLPNTFYAKKISSLGYFVHRIRQTSEFLIPLLPFFMLAVSAYLQLRKKVRFESAFISFLLLLLFSFSFVSRNEWMPGFRYELPFIPLLMILSSIGLFRVFSMLHLSKSSGKLVLVTSFPILLLLGIGLLYKVTKLVAKGEEFTRSLNRAHVPLGKWLRKYAPDNASYASWDMGAVPYYSGLKRIIDINSEGLLNTYTTQKGYNIDHFLSGNPSFLVLPPDSSYVRPEEIRHFYCNEKVKKEYKFLFTVAFEKKYLMNVFMHKDLELSADALIEGRSLADDSMLAINTVEPDPN